MVWNNRGVGFCHVSVLMVMVFGSTLLLLSGCKKGQGREAPSPPTVEVLEVIRKDVPVYSEWIASTDGLVNATIRAQVQGYLVRQNYKEGDFVKKGQVLFEIDPRPLQAALDQAKATWSRAKATLEQAKADVARAEAQYTNAKATLDRVQPLAEVNAVSKKDLDDAVGAERSAHASLVAAQASIEASQASVLATQAALEKAQLDLGFTHIISLIDGIAGIAKAQIGNLVGPGSIEELTTVSTVDPIKVYIPMSEQEYLRDMQNGRGRIRQQVPLELILADGSSIHKRACLPLRTVKWMLGPVRLRSPPSFPIRETSFGRDNSPGSVPRGKSRKGHLWFPSAQSRNSREVIKWQWWVSTIRSI